MNTNNQAKPVEAILWSVALPGFGQILNKKLIKGIIFILLEVIINVQSHFNMTILHSFNGNISAAIEVTDFQWLMFYPCVYMFAIWDAYRDSKGGKIGSYSFLPYVIGAYFLTIGLMYSTKITVFGILLGPVFLPILFLMFGLIVGSIIMKYLRKKLLKKSPT